MVFVVFGIQKPKQQLPVLLLEANTSPLCALMICLERYNPKPVPAFLNFALEFVLNFSYKSLSFSSGM